MFVDEGSYREAVTCVFVGSVTSLLEMTVVSY